MKLMLGMLLMLLPWGAVAAQVHYFEDGRPWRNQANRGPDAVVDGWYYNLGLTGMRAQLIPERPRHLLIKHVFAGSPANRKVRVGDYIVGVGGTPFTEPHQNGYGEEVFGAAGPIRDFAKALEFAQSAEGNGTLVIDVERQGKPLQLKLKIGKRYGAFSASYPAADTKTSRILKDLYGYLEATQQPNGSWGSPPHDTFAPLALLASGQKRYLNLVRKNVRYHAASTQAKDSSWLINWRYMAAAIVMSEFYLATEESWVLDELQEVHDFLISSQYVDLSQIDAKTRKERPQDLPKTPTTAHGGWGHNPGFEGYGPISMLTGQGALAFALMEKCGVNVDRQRHKFAYDFLGRAAGRNGYVWYADQAAGQDNWADMGRTGAAGIANAVSPYPEAIYQTRALSHARVIGDHPESFPDTHGSPIMGMGYAALAAFYDAPSFRRLMDENRWWFALSQCPDGTFYYQPNRDNAGYGADSRLSASAVTAFIFSIPNQSLFMTRRREPAKGADARRSGKTLEAYLAGKQGAIGEIPLGEHSAIPQGLFQNKALNALAGNYRWRRIANSGPQENEYHQGQLTLEQGEQGPVFRWTNAGGASWQLFPELAKAALRCEPSAPYYQQGDTQFLLIPKENAQGDYTNEIAGFYFQGLFYRREIAVTGNYSRQPVENGWHRGSIQERKQGDELAYLWVNEAGKKWNLIPDLEEEVLRTDETNPYQKTGAQDFHLIMQQGEVVGFRFGGEQFIKQGAKILSQRSQGLHGYISMQVEAPPAGYQGGVSFYSTVWPLVPEPLQGFQIGLPSTWIIPDNRDFMEPLCPPGTVARDHWPERAPYYRNVFQTIEGGTGYWVSTRFPTRSPKYRMNGTPNGYTHEISSPGWGFGKTAALQPEQMGIAQLSNRLLVPPDGVTFEAGASGKVFGTAWLTLPIVSAQTGPDVSTGDQSWTLFLNTGNFKGPVAFFVPATWSRLSRRYPTIVGRGLDARPALMNSGAMEVNTVPCFEATDQEGVLHTKIPRIQFPTNQRGETILMQDITFYKKHAYRPNGSLDLEQAWKPKLTALPIRFDQGSQKRQLAGVEQQVQTKIFGSPGEQAFGLQWQRTPENKKNPMAALPEYYKQIGNEHVAISASQVPPETGLLQQQFQKPNSDAKYSSPRSGIWDEPGPQSNKKIFSRTLTDGSTVTYAWYRFVDQPAFQAFTWTDQEKKAIQTKVERFHERWPIDRDYIPPPSSGELVSVDPAMVVMPPPGLEAGYVPIVLHQAIAKEK